MALAARRAGPSGIAAMSSGRAGLPGGDAGARGPVGPKSQEELNSGENGSLIGLDLERTRFAVTTGQ